MNTSRRLATLSCFLLLPIIITVFPLTGLQLLESDSFGGAAIRNASYEFSIPAARGDIVDRNGRLVAGTRYQIDLELFPFGIDEDVLLTSEKRLAEILELPINEVRFRPFRSLYNKPDPIRRNLNDTEVALISAYLYELPGVVLTKNPVRWYPFGSIFSHSLGYVHRSDQDGLTGIEQKFDKEITGINGLGKIVVNARGEPAGEIEMIRDPRQGERLKLTLDLDWQSAASQACDELLAGETAAAVVVLNSRTGEVLALTSYPSYAPDLLLDPRRDPSPLLRDTTNNPLLFRAVAGLYPPGSAFKLVTALAALEREFIDPHTVFHCSGTWHRRRCWILAARGHGHGNLDLSKAIANSCNVYFYHLGAKMTAEPILETARRLGFGKKTELKFPGEAAGLLPDPDKQVWYPGDNLNLAIGQGSLLVTPLQMARLAAMIASGKKIEPYITWREPSAEPKELGFKRENLRVIRDAMRKVVTEGTARWVRFPLKVHGKTSTVQNPRGLPHAWFVGFVEEPAISFAVVVEHGGSGSQIAAPLAARMMELFIERQGDVL